MSDVDVSVVCRAGKAAGDLHAILREYRDVLVAAGVTAEFLFVLESSCPADPERLAAERTDGATVRVYRMARDFGEAAALQHGFSRARGRYVLTIPDQPDIDPAGVHDILRHLREGYEVVVTRREPRRDATLNRLQSRIFHMFVRRITGGPSFHDLTCGLRGLTRRAANQLELYGDFHRFIPVLAMRRGFRTIEIPVAQRKVEQGERRLFGPGVYARRLLDVVNVFFLSRFARKPLRFFGLIGMLIGLVGAAICVVLAVQRILRISALGDRPLLLLGVLLVVLGVQLASIGLLGEVIIFFSSRREQPEARELTVTDDERRAESPDDPGPPPERDAGRRDPGHATEPTPR